MISLQTLAQTTSDYSYSYSSTSSSDAAAGVVILLILGFIFLLAVALYIFNSVCLMKIFKKAGRADAWAAWVPIYQLWVYFEVAGRPGWWALLSMISPLNIVLAVIGSIDMAKSFGKDTTFGVVLAFIPVVGYPMLAFGDAQYQGPAGPDAPKTETPQSDQAAA